MKRKDERGEEERGENGREEGTRCEERETGLMRSWVVWSEGFA